MRCVFRVLWAISMLFALGFAPAARAAAPDARHEGVASRQADGALEPATAGCNQAGLSPIKSASLGAAVVLVIAFMRRRRQRARVVTVPTRSSSPRSSFR